MTNIPKYLHSSEFFKTLDLNDEIYLPFKEDTSINNKEDLIFLIKTLNI